MMSPETIQSMQQEARQRASEEGLVPYRVAEEDIEAWKNGRGLPLPFPFIGDYVPDGYEPEGDALFVDTSGFGAPDEPAMTLTQFLDELEADKAYAITTVGQFQAYVQKFTRVENADEWRDNTMPGDYDRDVY